MAVKMNFIDLFSGCGGLSLGLLNAGLNGLFAIEKNPDAFATLKKNLIDKNKYHKNSFKWNFPDLPISSHDINELIENEKYYNILKKLADEKLVDIIVGGPPCQGFSLAGKRNPNDPRNKLAESYLKIVNIIRPKFILMENVKGISLKFDKENDKLSTSDKIKKQLRNMGYITMSFLENSSSWGVPQSRTRFILLGIKRDLFSDSLTVDEIEEMISNVVLKNINNFHITFARSKNISNKTTSSDAISDLKILNSSLEKEETETSQDAPGNRFQQLKYKKSKNELTPYQRLMRSKIKNDDYIAGGMRLANHSFLVSCRFKKIHNDITSEVISKKYNLSSGVNLPKKYISENLSTRKHTIFVLDKNKVSATITTLPDDLLHYDEPRILTVRECARIQSFPDWYEFIGPYTTGGNRRKVSCPKYTQVGNAVPPIMAEGLGVFILKKLEYLITTVKKT